jgi:hypothetical protein
LVLELGETYLAAGNNEKAIAAIRQAADDQPAVVMLNDAAYALADKGVDLEDALKYGKGRWPKPRAIQQKSIWVIWRLTT